MRCFVAVELSRAARDELTRLLDTRLPRHPELRWCTPGQLHVTLRFLGEIEEALLPRICQLVAEVSRRRPPFLLRLSGFGVFPSAARPRVFWCGLSDPQDGCGGWARAAEPELTALGLPPEQRACHAHVTLGRSRGPQGGAQLARLLRELAAPASCETWVEEIVLFQSRLSPAGAAYTPLMRAPLAG